jgi:DNA helicase-2/ATP-dependent DNA helicase PcrA
MVNIMKQHKYKVSKYQQAIFDWVKDGKGNAVIQAVAGSGKTSTIVDATKLIPMDKKCVFVAFNKAIADELRDKVSKYVEARTLHSLGLSFFKSNGLNPQVDSSKIHKLIESELDDINDSRKSEYYSFLRKILPLIKNSLIDYTNLEQLEEIKEKFNITDDIDDRLMLAIRKIMEANNKDMKNIDFDDMIYLPVINNLVNGFYDWVLVDESQDLNRAQFELIKKVCNKNTRVIAVGDKRQSIYAFRGADTSSMDNFISEFHAVELPLSICYRCPKSHIRLAQEIVPEIEASDFAEEGIVDDIRLLEAIELANDNQKDLVLCRTNAPLIKVAFTLIRNGKKAIIRGRDIGANLIKMIEKYKAKDLGDLYVKLEAFKRLQEDKLELIERGKYDQKKKNSILTNIDSVETIIAVMEDCDSIQEVTNKIEKIFSDEKEGIICSSVHRAKGLQAETVFIVNRDRMPHPMAHTDEEIEQEYNILYVALTRSKNALYMITDML